MKPIRTLTLALLALGAIAARATDLTYTTPIATGDSPLVMANKQAAVAVNGDAFHNLTGNATTTVKTGSGVLERIVINTAGTSSTITVYDNTAGSGTKIATASGNAQTVLSYNVRFATGLTIVTTGSPDVTVGYR
jgi:uncharacterized protein (AIM24 family)